MDVVVDEVIDKEATKGMKEVNMELVKEVNEGLVLVCIHGDGRRGDHKVNGSGAGAGKGDSPFKRYK